VEPSDNYWHPADRETIPPWLVWCTAEIRRQPVTALSIAAVTGFILGGGMRSRLGRQILTVAGTSLARGVMMEVASELVKQNEGDGG
jgi:hypothetical protein